MSMRTDAVLSNIKTTDGNFYVGMTLEEAKEQGHSIFKKFKEIDNSKLDGVLSYDEIMNCRNNKIKKQRTWKNIFGGIALYKAFDGFLLEKLQNTNCAKHLYEKVPECMPNRKVAFATTCILFCITLTKHFKIKKAEKQNKEYRQLYCEYMENNQQKDKVA